MLAVRVWSEASTSIEHGAVVTVTENAIRLRRLPIGGHHEASGAEQGLINSGFTGQAMIAHLYLSFWHLCLDNLPKGHFERSVIGTDDARTMIRDARSDEKLLCVSKDNLLAPYRVRERRRHEELCELLRTRCNFDVRFEDFLITFHDDGGSVQSIMPLEVVGLRPDDSLLIVTCNYRLVDKTDGHVDLEDRFALAADFLGFHLITALPVQEVAACVTPAGLAARPTGGH